MYFLLYFLCKKNKKKKKFKFWEKNNKTNKKQKIIGTYKKYRDKLKNYLLYMPKEQVEQYVSIDKRMKPEDLVYGKRRNYNTFHF